MTDVNLPAVAPTDAVEEIWGRRLQTAGCARCGQAHLVDQERMGSTCPHCLAGRLQPQPALLRSEAPEKILPFRMNRTAVTARLAEFTRSVWLRPDDFNPDSLLRRAVPVFVPMWLVDGQVCGEWKAEVGFDYQVKSSQEMYQGSAWKTREVIETRVRWEPRLGQLQRMYDNVHAPAVSDHAALWRLLGGWPLDKAVPYQAAALQTDLGPAALRVADLPPEEAWHLAEDGLLKAAAADCYQASGAQHVRSFHLTPRYDNLHWTYLLLPVLVSYYTDDSGQVQPIYINGVSGAVGGKRLASQRKGWLWAGALAGLALLLFILAGLGLAAGALFPPAALLGVFFGFLALVAGAGAIFPAVWPWQWNRGQQGVGVRQSSRA
jgi:hypothetical protein